MLKEILSFLTISTFTSASVAYAQTTIFPIPVQVEKNKAILTVRDDGTKYIAKIYRWIQKDGEDKLVEVDEKEATIFPYMFIAKPTGTPIKIVILKEKENQEQSYRIILEEVKTNSMLNHVGDREKDNIETGISIQKSFSIPVFVRGKDEKVSYSISCKNKTINIENTGTKHIKIVTLDDRQENQYVLPGSIKRFSVENLAGIIKLSDNTLIRYICF